MTKELFVSSTPHETSVGMVEDDQLAEIYLERENEYTLAGSIYKGKVTRVLPGMQSAFVDIGLERDAFLYVSDFMELSEQDEDVDEIVPTARQLAEPKLQQLQVDSQSAAAAPAMAREAEPQPETPQEPAVRPVAAPENLHANGETQSREPRGWRGRRRRGRGGRGDRGIPESRFARPTSETAAPARSSENRGSETRGSETRISESRSSEYGPPPGYQPIILPGESISKYQRWSQRQPLAPQTGTPTSGPQNADQPAAIARTFPEDEPLFAKAEAEPLHEQHEAAAIEPHEDHRESTSAWQREQGRFDRMNVASVFGGDAAETVEDDAAETEEVIEKESSEAQAPTQLSSIEHTPTSSAGAAGTVTEEEIEEEEADLASYVEDLQEDATFEELEEETRAAEDYHQPVARQVSATGEQPEQVTPVDISAGDEEAGEASGENEDAEELELEEAQAEAEALLDAEAGGNASLEAHAEVRAPAGTAGYTQRAQRPAFDPRRQRGRRGGRRFRRNEVQPTPLITDLLKEGQEILVQIAKEPIGKKGARITSHIALPGRFLVYMPTVNHTGVSRKISSVRPNCSNNGVSLVYSLTRLSSAGWKRLANRRMRSYSCSLSTQMAEKSEVTWSRNTRSTTFRS